MNNFLKTAGLRIAKLLCELGSHIAYALYNACDTFFFSAVKRGDDEKAADWNARAQGYLALTNLLDHRAADLEQRIHELRMIDRVTVEDIRGYYNEARD